MDQSVEIEQSPSKKQSEAFCDILEKVPPPSLGRNGPCSCGSGLKYKKCCLGKKRKNTPSTLRTESFKIKADPLTPEESKNNFQAVSPEDGMLMATLYHNLHEHPETIDSEDCEYFQKLNALYTKYPDNPIILNFLGSGYEHLGQEDRVRDLIAKTYERFPDYLFAKTAKAGLYLTDGFPEKALEVLKGAYTLKQLYPDRTVFHVSEVRTFEYFMVRYFTTIGNIEQVEMRLKIMKGVLDEDDALLLSAQQDFKKAKAPYKFKAAKIASLT